MRHGVSAAAVVALLAGACASGTGDAVVVLAASSLVDLANDAVMAWDGHATVSDAGSQVLRAQVVAGAPADLVLLADPDIADGLHRDGHTGPPTPLASTGLAVAVSRGAAGRVTSPADLADPDLTVVLADDTVPLGSYTRQALQRLERTGAAPRGTERAVLAGADSYEDAARLVLAKITSGDADAAVVYRTDVLAAQRAGQDIRLVPWPPAADVEATYTGQVVLGRGREAAARRLLDFLASPAAAPVWRQHGFRPRVGDSSAGARPGHVEPTRG